MSIQELSQDLPVINQPSLSAEEVNGLIRLKNGRMDFAGKSLKPGMLFLAVLFLWSVCSAQILHPVHWSYAAKKLNANEAVIMLKADIDPGWHIYSTVQPDGGPVKTSFVFAPSVRYTVVGTISEPKPVTRYEKAFEMNVSYFENMVIFQQKVTLRQAQGDKTVIKGTLRFMVCNDKQCLPPENVSFSIPVK